MGKIRALTTFFVASGLVCLAPGSSSAVQQTSKQPVRIAIVSDGPLGRYREVPADLRQEISDLLSLAPGHNTVDYETYDGQKYYKRYYSQN